MEAIDNDYLILSDAQRDLLAKNNTFAINLFNKTNGMDSRVISPLSVTGLMTILANGADGDTRQEILNTLGWTGASMEEINEIYGLLVKQAGVIDPSVTVNVADYVAVNKDNRINNEFGKTVGDLFGTEVRNLDFASPKTVNTINGWCSKHTGGMIPRIIDNVDPGAVAYLMNAIYFNGPWAERFQTKDTKVEAFRGYTRDIKKVKMMHRNDEYSYTANGTYSAVRLPYGNGSFAMTVLLPNEAQVDRRHDEGCQRQGDREPWPQDGELQGGSETAEVHDRGRAAAERGDRLPRRADNVQARRRLQQACGREYVRFQDVPESKDRGERGGHEGRRRHRRHHDDVRLRAGASPGRVPRRQTVRLHH